MLQNLEFYATEITESMSLNLCQNHALKVCLQKQKPREYLVMNLDYMNIRNEQKGFFRSIWVLNTQ